MRVAVFVPLLLTVALALHPADAAAQGHGLGDGFLQGPVEAGLRGGRDFKNDTWLLGGQVLLPLRENFELRPSGDLLFPEGGETGWQLNGDAAIRFGTGDVYAGGGVAFLHPGGGETGTGYNLFFGLALSDSPWAPFLEFRWSFVDELSPFRLMLGFTRRL